MHGRDTEGKWYRQASGHPNWGITDFELNNKIAVGPELFFEGFPDGFIKDNEVDLPDGLNVNPLAAPSCTTKQAEEGKFGVGAGECLAEKGAGVIVGTNYFTVGLKPPTSGECVPAAPTPTEVAKCAQARVNVPVFNVKPEGPNFEGVPSMVAFPTTTGVTFIVGDLDPTNQAVIFRVTDIESPLEGGTPVVGSRLVFNGRAGDGTYLTMPSACTGEEGQTTTLKVDSHDEPPKTDTQDFTTAVGTIGCNAVEFEPKVDVTSTVSHRLARPGDGGREMPFNPSPTGTENSRLLDAKVVLPEGTSLNPSVANGLETCSDAQFGQGTDNPIQCPAGSKIGTVVVKSQALYEDLGGDVYVGDAAEPESGLRRNVPDLHPRVQQSTVRCQRPPGRERDPEQSTGQLTAVVAKNPQRRSNISSSTSTAGRMAR